MGVAPGWRLAVGAALLCAVTALSYTPVLNAAFLSLDDVDYVAANPNLRDSQGLHRIWDPQEARYPLMYYPLTFSSFWIEHQLWGTEARFYHATNLALHLLNVVLVLLLIRSFGVPAPVALSAAAVFALHPLQVASVAWVAERKNLLSATFYLAAFLAFVRHRSTGGAWSYAACLAAFTAALLSKTQTLTFPASLVLADLALQKTGRLAKSGVKQLTWRILPMVFLAVAAALITLTVEARPDVPSFSLTTRALIASNAAWFYVAKLFAPIHLAPIYPRWSVSAGDVRWWLAVAAWLLVIVGVVRGRRRIGALPLWGVAHFFIALAPALGLVSWGFMELSFVADHFLYLSLLGGGLALAVWAVRVAGTASSWTRRRTAVVVVGVLWLFALALQTHAQCRHWQDNLSFWRHVVEENPDGYTGNLSLGMQLDSHGEPEKAIPYLRKAARIRPRLARPFRRYVGALGKARGPEAAIAACNEKIAEEPRFVVAYLERALHEERLHRTEEARRDYRRVRQSMPKGSPLWREAVEGLRRLDAPAGPRE